MIKADNNFCIGAIRIIICVPYIPGRTDTGAAVFFILFRAKAILIMENNSAVVKTAIFIPFLQDNCKKPLQC
jgi:hypothetical protein